MCYALSKRASKYKPKSTTDSDDACSPFRHDGLSTSFGTPAIVKSSPSRNRVCSAVSCVGPRDGPTAQKISSSITFLFTLFDDLSTLLNSSKISHVVDFIVLRNFHRCKLKRDLFLQWYNIYELKHSRTSINSLNSVCSLCEIFRFTKYTWFRCRRRPLCGSCA